MIYGIGTDIIEIDRIQKACTRPGFLERNFSQRERAYFDLHGNKAESIAGGFAAKEAFSKALGTGVRDFSLKDVEVLHDSLGKPYIEAQKLLGGRYAHLTISHSKAYATAMVIIEEGVS